jgi:hypothetical protein
MHDRDAHSSVRLPLPIEAKRFSALLLVGALLCVTACDDQYRPFHYSYPDQSNGGAGVIQLPTPINLYPSSEGSRLYVMVTAVGSQAVSMPLAFDTGSAGITLNASAIGFPSSMFSASGFVFPADQSSLTYGGITVTNQQGTRSYGGAGGKTQTGNLGFAQVTFGDESGALTTSVMPVFLYYKVTLNAPPYALASENHDGWFGVNTEANKIAVTTPIPGAAENLPCTLDTGASCYVVSVLKYLSYAPWLDAGFALAPAALQPCNIFDAGACPPAPMLTVGLSSESEAGFSQVTLTCPQSNYAGPDIIVGYPVCQDLIPFSDVTLAAPGKSPITLNNLAVLFDSGNPAADINQSNTPLSSPLPVGTVVTVTTPSAFIYQYPAEAQGITETFFDTSINTGFGINFFTEHALFINFTTSTEGWM